MYVLKRVMDLEKAVGHLPAITELQSLDALNLNHQVVREMLKLENSADPLEREIYYFSVIIFSKKLKEDQDIKYIFRKLQSLKDLDFEIYLSGLSNLSSLTKNITKVFSKDPSGVIPLVSEVRSNFINLVTEEQHILYACILRNFISIYAIHRLYEDWIKTEIITLIGSNIYPVMEQMVSALETVINLKRDKILDPWIFDVYQSLSKYQTDQHRDLFGKLTTCISGNLKLPFNGFIKDTVYSFYSEKDPNQSQFYYISAIRFLEKTARISNGHSLIDKSDFERISNDLLKLEGSNLNFLENTFAHGIYILINHSMTQISEKELFKHKLFSLENTSNVKVKEIFLSYIIDQVTLDGIKQLNNQIQPGSLQNDILGQKILKFKEAKEKELRVLYLDGLVNLIMNHVDKNDEDHELIKLLLKFGDEAALGQDKLIDEFHMSLIKLAVYYKIDRKDHWLASLLLNVFEASEYFTWIKLSYHTKHMDFTYRYDPLYFDTLMTLFEGWQNESRNNVTKRVDTQVSNFSSDKVSSTPSKTILEQEEYEEFNIIIDTYYRIKEFLFPDYFEDYNMLQVTIRMMIFLFVILLPVALFLPDGVYLFILWCFCLFLHPREYKDPLLASSSKNLGIIATSIGYLIVVELTRLLTSVSFTSSWIPVVVYIIAEQIATSNEITNENSRVRRSNSSSESTKQWKYCTYCQQKMSYNASSCSYCNTKF